MLGCYTYRSIVARSLLYFARHIINNSKPIAESSSIHLYFLIVMPATVSQTDRQTQITQILTTAMKSRRTRWAGYMERIEMNKKCL